MATIFGHLTKRSHPAPENKPEPIVTDPLLSAILAGEKITKEMALSLPAVAGAVDLIASAVAAMPIRLYRRIGDRVEAVDDPRVHLLNLDTKDTLDAFQMRRAMVIDYLLLGAGYCYIDRNYNNVIGLYFVDNKYISVINNYQPIYKDFTVLVLGKEYRPYQFIKLLRNTQNGSEGAGLIDEIGKTIETAYSTLLYQLRTAKTGGTRKGFITSEKHLTQENIDIIRRSWEMLYQGDEEKTPVLNEGIKFHEINNTAVESQVNETQKTITDEIYNLFHIYPDFLQTFKLAIYPVVKAFETALNRDLLLEQEKAEYFFEFDPKEILRVSIKERYEAYRLAKETGFMTLNEIRAAENLDWVEGLDVVNVGLGAVLYNTITKEFYTPNTDRKSLAGTKNMLEGHVLAEEFDASGNSSRDEVKPVAVDFDGTLAEAGQIVPERAAKLLELQEQGVQLILWTARTGADLEDALAQCEQFGIVFSDVVENKPDVALFVDDKAVTIDDLEV